MGVVGELEELDEETTDDEQAVDSRKEFVEVVLWANTDEGEEKLDCKKIDEESINYLVGEVVGEDVESGDGEGDSDEESRDEFWQPSEIMSPVASLLLLYLSS